MNKVVVITGASAGVGRATAEEFARNGYDVALLARDPERLERVAAELRSTQGVRTASRHVPTTLSRRPRRRRKTRWGRLTSG